MSNSKKLILLVEDDKETAELLSKGIERHDYEVITAFDGLGAKDSISENKPDIIILDLMLPKCNGWQVLEWLRNEIRSDTPVIILSAKGDITDLEKGMLNADTYLIKPITIEKVLSAIKMIETLRQ